VLLVAFAAGFVGLGAGYILWGWPPNWYAFRDVYKLPPSPENQLIQYGWQLIVETPRLIGKSATDPKLRYAGNDLACSQCHLKAGTKAFAAPFISTFASFPMMVNDEVLTLTERINGCMTRSMNGQPLPENGREMNGLIAYIRFVGKNTPEAVRIAGMGLMPVPPALQTPDRARGEKIFSDTCASCHGTNGQGQRKLSPEIGFSVPPLWGPDSFNSAAGMSHITTAAAFIRANMPYLTTDYSNPLLGEQQAWDVADYVTSQSRPPVPAADGR
jgi:thiosulfate dehydrogenase